MLLMKEHSELKTRPDNIHVIGHLCLIENHRTNTLADNATLFPRLWTQMECLPIQILLIKWRLVECACLLFSRSAPSLRYRSLPKVNKHRFSVYRHTRFSNSRITPATPSSSVLLPIQIFNPLLTQTLTSFLKVLLPTKVTEIQGSRAHPRQPTVFPEKTFKQIAKKGNVHGDTFTTNKQVISLLKYFLNIIALPVTEKFPHFCGTRYSVVDKIWDPHCSNNQGHPNTQHL